MSKYTPYPAGAEVEVRTLEKGFNGAWFEATVESFSHLRRRYAVTYASLVSDENPAAPLRDIVHLRNIRPRPPRALRGARFALHRVVDAFHNDAWWKGVVSAVPDQKDGGGRYRVCFPYSHEEFEFEEGDIREHVWLVRGKWVSIEAEGEHDMMFDVGTLVEVSRDKENFGSAWFPGTGLKVIGKSYLLVEYEGLWVEYDGNKRTLLQEIVGLPYIRPSPPPDSMSFDVLDEVEAFHCGGWFSGIVLTIISPFSRYIIKFKHQDEELEFDRNGLRPHFSWVNGKWIHINQKNCSRGSALRGTKSAGNRHKSEGQKNPCFSSSVPILKNNDGELDDGSLKLKVKKAEGPDLDSQVNLSQSHKNLKKRKSLEHSLMVDASSSDRNCEATTMVQKHSSTAAPMLESPNPIDQIRTPRSSRTPRAIKSSFAVAPLLGAATSKHQIKPSLLHKKLKTGNSLEKLVGSSSKTATKVLENSVSERPSPALGSQHSKSSSTSVKAGTNLPSISCNRSSKAADRSSVDLKDKKVERPNLDCQFKSSEFHKKAKKRKFVELIKRQVDGILRDSGSKTPTLLRNVSSSSVPVLESPNLQGQIKLPHSRKFKEINALVEDQLVEGSLLEHGSKAPTKAGKSTSATPLLKESPALMDRPQHLERPSLVKIAVTPEVGTKLPLNPSNRGLCQDQDMSRVSATNESMISGEGYSNCNGTEHQPKAANISHSSVNHETTNLTSIAKTNAKVGRKKLVIRAPHHRRKAANADVRKPSQDKVRRRGKGRLPRKRIADINGMELKKVEERTEQDGKGEGNLPISDDSYRSDKLLDRVEGHSETPQIGSSSQDAGNVNYTTTQLPTTVVSKSFDIEVQGIRSCMNVSSGVGVQAETHTLLSTSKEDSANEKIDLAPTGSPYDKAAVEVERAPIITEPSRSSSFKENDGRDRNRLTSSVPPVEKAIEMDISPVDARPTVQSLLKEVNVENHNELNSVEFLIKKTMVEMDRASVNPTPKGVSPSRVGDICDHNEVIPNGSESVNAIEMEERTHISPVHSGPPSRTPLPFTKQSTMWDSVQLMDVYQTVPQQPHFRPLEQYNMEFREGIAIGLMVTYANLVAGIKKLSIVDSQVVFEEKLRALASLESNGFNIQFLRTCLEKLLEIRRTYNHLNEKKVDLGGKLAKKEDENSQLDALICAHDKVFVEVEESLTSYRKKLSSLHLERNNMDMEIVQLEMDLQAADEAYQSAEENFNNAVVAPW